MQSLKQEPSYLPDVENNPQPSRYLDLIRTSQSNGRETWNLWYLFAFRPEMTQHLARFTQEAMREPSPLSPGLRELIAAYTPSSAQLLSVRCSIFTIDGLQPLVFMPYPMTAIGCTARCWREKDTIPNRGKNTWEVLQQEASDAHMASR